MPSPFSAACLITAMSLTVSFHAGDILWCPAEHKHWHGATPDAAMTHIAIQESLDGSAVTWMEKVSDEQFLAPLGTG